MQPHTLASTKPISRSKLSAMFEEDFERCFICQQPSRGLYCSSECRTRDQGTASPAVKASAVPPVRLTSQLPATLSPRHRATHQIGPSPKMPPHVPPRGADSSSSSSITSSPIQSPRTNPGSGADSPQKDPINLPPPAFPSQHTGFAFPGSVPVKIPKLAPKPTNSPQPTNSHTGSHGTSLFGIANSIDTLRFGRKPGVVNSVKSPNALTPRCACGKPAGHAQRRASSKERLEGAVAGLSLGPSLIAPIPQPGGRVVSNPTNKAGHSGHSTPLHRDAAMSADLEHHTISSTLSGSLLSRSRSDPIPPSPKDVRQSLIAPLTRQDPSAVLPMTETVPGPTTSRSPRRGRSLERQHPRGLELSEAGPLNQSREREQAPSRSRHRRDERPERRASAHAQAQASSTAGPAFGPRPVYANAAEADWTRRAPPNEQAGEGIVPASRRQDSGDRGRSGYGIRTHDL